jgi:hypothetical protein
MALSSGFFCLKLGPDKVFCGDASPFVGYPEDGDLRIDNNLSKRAVSAAFLTHISYGFNRMAAIALFIWRRPAPGARVAL